MQECCVLQVMADGHIFSIIIMGNGYYNYTIICIFIILIRVMTKNTLIVVMCI